MSEFVQAMTMKVSKGLGVPVVAPPSVGHMLAAGEEEKEAAKELYGAATRAAQRLLISESGDVEFEQIFSPRRMAI